MYSVYNTYNMYTMTSISACMPLSHALMHACARVYMCVYACVVVYVSFIFQPGVRICAFGEPKFNCRCFSDQHSHL